MSGSLWLLPVALGDTAWEGFLPPATRDDAFRTRAPPKRPVVPSSPVRV